MFSLLFSGKHLSRAFLKKFKVRIKLRKGKVFG